MDEVWKTIMSHEKDDTRHQTPPDEVANDLRKDEVETILATMEFFGAGIDELTMTVFDLAIARYRVFDWLAMAVSGRIPSRQAVQVLAHSFIKSAGDVDRFIADLRETDYDVVRDWEELEV